MFDDTLMISDVVRYGYSCVSVNAFGPTRKYGPIAKPVVGLITPSSIAASTLNTFITEPASYTSVTGRLRAWFILPPFGS